MKKVNIFLTIIFVLSLTAFAISLSYAIRRYEQISDWDKSNSPIPANLKKFVVLDTIMYICNLIISSFAFAIFVLLNPRLFRRSTYTDIKANAAAGWAQNKAERAARKQAKSETDKQKRIEALQKELDALKKDDAPPSEE